MGALLRLVLSACVLGAPLLAPAAAAQILLVADGASSATGMAKEVGRVATFICPSTATKPGLVYGSDVYDIGSDICTAAVHAGVHTFGETNRVTIRIGGRADLLAEERNGIASRAWAGVSATYSFISNDEIAQIDWNTSYDRAPDGLPPLTLRCPPNGAIGSSVIGSGVYRADSSICLAGVHAGVITLAEGGLVTVTFQPRRETLTGTKQNDVTSIPWSDATYAAYPQPYSVAKGMPQRRFTLAGFTAVGDAPLIVPRQVKLDGFTAVGSAPKIEPRIVRLDGWTLPAPEKLPAPERN